MHIGNNENIHFLVSFDTRCPIYPSCVSDEGSTRNQRTNHSLIPKSESTF